MPSHAKRFTAAPVSIPVSASLHPLSLTGHTGTASPQPVTLPSTTKFGQSASREAQRHGPTLSSQLALNPNPSSIAAPTTRPRSGSTSTWSPSLFRKLRWRLRQYSLWEMSVLVAFIVATVVFFSALMGVGYIPEDNERFASGWRAPGPGVLRHGVAPTASASGLIDGFLRLTGLGWKTTVTDAHDEQQEMESEWSEPTYRNARHRAHQRLHFGARQSLRQRMVPERMHILQTTRDTSSRVPYIEPPQLAPHHDSFHKRVEEPSGSSQMSLDEPGEEKESFIRQRDIDYHSDSKRSEEDVMTKDTESINPGS